MLNMFHKYIKNTYNNISKINIIKYFNQLGPLNFKLKPKKRDSN